MDGASHEMGDRAVGGKSLGPDEVVGYIAFDVRAKVGPGLVGMVNLVVALCVY